MPGNWTTWRSPDDCKETQTAVVWSCLPFIRSGQNHLARHSERGKKTKQTKEEVGRQHRGMDRPGVRQVPEGSGEQGKMEKSGWKSSVMPQRPSRLRDWWWWWWLSFGVRPSALLLASLEKIRSARTNTDFFDARRFSFFWVLEVKKCWLVFHLVSLLLCQCQMSKTQQTADKNSMFHAFLFLWHHKTTPVYMSIRIYARIFFDVESLSAVKWPSRHSLLAPV